jgi:hypothetical protein
MPRTNGTSLTTLKRSSSDGRGFCYTDDIGLCHRFTATDNCNRWRPVMYSTWRLRPDIIPSVGGSCLIWWAALGDDIPVALKQWVGMSVMVLIRHRRLCFGGPEPIQSMHMDLTCVCMCVGGLWDAIARSPVWPSTYTYGSVPDLEVETPASVPPWGILW